MVVVQTMFFDSDDFEVVSESIPCEDKETAKKLVKNIYEKMLENYDFDEEDEDYCRAAWEKRRVKWNKNGSVEIKGGDCGYGWIEIIDKEPVTASTVSSCKFEIGSIY